MCSEINKEFDLIGKDETLKNFSTEFASLDSNSKKNRYSNILPYDYNVVKLGVRLGVNENPPSKFEEYINASFITMDKNFRMEDAKIIATQGPQENTTESFWRMIWEYKIKTIVMLTNFIENGKIKCCEYFPQKLNEKMRFGDIKIKLLEIEDEKFYIKRTLFIKKDEEYETVYHYQYLEWEDMKNPEIEHFTIFFEKIKELLPYKMVVHCSAGVGRTGVLLTVLCHVQTHKHISECLKMMRKQRKGMVKTLDQYKFVYEYASKKVGIYDNEGYIKITFMD